MANYAYDAFRNVCVGKTSDYTARKLYAGNADTAAFTANLYVFFVDEAAAATAVTHVFQSQYTAGEKPSFANITTGANKPVLASVTTGTVSIGALDADNTLFTGTSVMDGSTQYENFIIFKYDVTAATALARPCSSSSIRRQVCRSQPTPLT